MIELVQQNGSGEIESFESVESRMKRDYEPTNARCPQAPEVSLVERLW